MKRSGTCISISVAVPDIFPFSKKSQFSIAHFGSNFLFSSQTLASSGSVHAQM
jgi:hypothetical protein